MNSSGGHGPLGSEMMGEVFTKGPGAACVVIPAQAGIQLFWEEPSNMGPRFHGDDGLCKDLG